MGCERGESGVLLGAKRSDIRRYREHLQRRSAADSSVPEGLTAQRADFEGRRGAWGWQLHEAP
jgi:hypothetical protein